MPTVSQFYTVSPCRRPALLTEARFGPARGRGGGEDGTLKDRQGEETVDFCLACVVCLVIFQLENELFGNLQEVSFFGVSCPES